MLKMGRRMIISLAVSLLVTGVIMFVALKLLMVVGLDHDTSQYLAGVMSGVLPYLHERVLKWVNKFYIDPSASWQISPYKRYFLDWKIASLYGCAFLIAALS